jgi:DNA-binding transcriptional LysR family regulator
MELEVRHLRYFLAVADAGNFSRAAERLHLAQPALSQTVRRVEHTLGVRLFDRHPHGARLTADGEALVAASRRAVAALDEVRTEARRRRDGYTTVLRIGFLANAANELTPALLGAFRAAHPDVEVRVRQGMWDDPHCGLDRPEPDRAVDVAILRLPIDDPDHIATEALFAEPCDAVLYTAHPLAGHASLTVADLLDQPLVHNRSPDGPFRDFWLLNGYRRPHQPARIGGEYTTPDEWLSAITAGDGISICPRSAGRYYPRPGLAFRPVVDAPASVVALAWRPDDVTPAVRAFLDISRTVRDTDPLTRVAAGLAP